MTLGEVLLTPTRIYAGILLDLRSSLDAAGFDLHGLAHITGGGLPGNAARSLPPGLAARLDPGRWPMPSVMRLFGALGGLEDDELRATFNGGLGMIAIVEPAAAGAVRSSLASAGIEAWLVGEVVDAGAAGRPALRRRRAGPGQRGGMTARIAVGVSGTGSNLRALAAAAERAELGGSIVLVFADRACPALDWAIEHGFETALVPARSWPTCPAGRPGTGSWPRR